MTKALFLCLDGLAIIGKAPVDDYKRPFSEFWTWHPLKGNIKVKLKGMRRNVAVYIECLPSYTSVI